MQVSTTLSDQGFWVKELHFYLKPSGKYWTSLVFVIGELQSHFLLDFNPANLGINASSLWERRHIKRGTREEGGKPFRD